MIEKLQKHCRFDIKMLLVFLLLILTRTTLKIANPFSVTNVAKVNIADIVMLLMGVYVVLYQLIIKQKLKALSKRSKIIFCLSVALCVYFGITTLCRYFIYDIKNISILMTQVILYGVVFYFMFELHYLNYKSFVKGLGLFFTAVNIWSITIFLITSNSIRTSELLGNINVYIGFAFVTTPLLIYHYIKHSDKKINCVLLYTNIFCTAIIFMFSGSRFGIWGYLFELVVVYLVAFGFKIPKKVLAWSGITIVCISVFCTGFYFANSKVKGDVIRTMQIPRTVINKVFGESTLKPNPEDVEGDDNDFEPEKDPEPPEATPDITNANPFFDNVPEDGVVVSLTRDRIYKRTSAILKEYWLFGTGRHSIQFYGWGYQSPHNYILEMLTCYGVVGSIIYAGITFYLIAYFIRRIKKDKRNILFLTSYLIVFTFSMVEPLLGDKLMIVLTVWGLGSGLIFEEKMKLNK